MDGGKRWGRGAYSMGWAVCMAAQVGVLVSLDPQQATTWLGVLAFQVLKVPVAFPRLRDLGRPLDDAVWTLVPLLNLGFFFQLLRKTPQEDRRQARMRSWSTQLTATGAFAQAGRHMLSASFGRNLGLTLAAAAGMAFLNTAVTNYMRELPATGGESTWASFLSVCIVMLGVYALACYAKRKTASRASMWPLVLFLPALLFWVNESFRGVPLQGLGVLVEMTPSMAMVSLMNATILPLVVAHWVLSVDDVVQEREDSQGLSRIRQAWAGLAAVYGARDQLVLIGIQIVVPGVWFAVSYVFADILVLLRPDRPAFSGSQALVKGIRQKIFKMLALYALVLFGVRVLVSLLFHDLSFVIVSLLTAPLLIAEEARLIGDIFAVFGTWWVTIAALSVFYERDRLLEAYKKRKAAAA